MEYDFASIVWFSIYFPLIIFLWVAVAMFVKIAFDLWRRRE